MLGKIFTSIKGILCITGVISLLGVQTAKADLIELALILDGSFSIISSDWTLQVEAYQNILNDDFMDNYINPGDELWITVYQFSTNVTNEIAMQKISTNAEAGALGDAIALITQDNEVTNTSGAVNAAVAELTGNTIDSDRMIIDISTDGEPTFPLGDPKGDAIAAATAASAAGVTVNAIGVGMTVSGELFLDEFTAAGGGQKWVAANFDAFESALSEKLLHELHSVPEPSVISLLGLGLLSLFGLPRRKRNSRN